MADKQHITLQLDAHRVALDVDRDKELIYREAAKLLNERYQFYLRRMPNASAEQLWVYVALSVGVNMENNYLPIDEKLTELNTKIKNICL